MAPLFQIAFDNVTSVVAADLASRMGDDLDWAEAGTPLIASEGMAAVRAQSMAVAGKRVVADLKIIDSGKQLVTLALDAGANVVTVLGCADDVVIREVVTTAHARGALVAADLLGLDDEIGRAHELAFLEVDYLTVHASAANESGRARIIPFNLIAILNEHVGLPVIVAGGVDHANMAQVLACNPAVVVAGSAVLKANDPVQALKELRREPRQFEVTL